MDEQNVQVLEGETDVWTIIRDISRAEAQEDAFYVCDLGNIVQKFRIWKKTLPRVQPFYGELKREKAHLFVAYYECF